MAKVSVLGLGSMGTALADCVVAAGHEVSVWNRTPGKAGALAAAGATVCDTADEAAAAADLVIVCIRSHKETTALIEGLTVPLAGKTVCDMSTGDTTDAETLVALLADRGAETMLGMINAYPSGIGQQDTTILTVGSPAAWQRHGDIIRTLGGRSAHVGETPKALAALFAGLFTVRQGFMFGMIYGALACKKAGIPMQVFADQIPASLKLVQDYYDLFARTVPGRDYDNPEASVKVYALAQEDALETVEAPDALIRLMHDRTRAAWDAGLGDKQLTALVDHLSN